MRRYSRTHVLLYRLTRGLVGRRLAGNDMLLLTTRGRRSGRKHTVPLLYLRDGRSLVVIASYGGRPDHPEWYLNLLDEPDAEVNTGRTTKVTARTANPEERAEWWTRVVDAYAGYADYQARSEREIPIVFLEPASD